MNYLVQAISEANGFIKPDEEIYWKVDEIRRVDAKCIKYYQDHSDVFTILSGPVIDTVRCPGNMAAAYIDFNGVGEAGMVVTKNGSVEYTEVEPFSDTEGEEEDGPIPAIGTWTNGASAATSATSLIAAINGDLRADSTILAIADETDDGIWLFDTEIGTAGNVTISTDSAEKCTVQNMAGGTDPELKEVVTIVHTVNTQELLSGTIDLPIPFTPTSFNINAFTATGAPVFFTDLVTVEEDPDRIRITTDGATNLANTNVIHLTVFG